MHSKDEIDDMINFLAVTGPGVHMLFLSFYIFRHFTVLYLMYGVIINVSERFNNQHKSKPT